MKHCVHYLYGGVSVRLECAQTILFLVVLIDYCPHHHLFLGHVLRMQKSSPPQRVLEFSATASLRGRLGRPRTTLLSALSQDCLARLGIRLGTLRGLNQLRQLAGDKSWWNGTPRHSYSSAETRPWLIPCRVNIMHEQSTVFLTLPLELDNRSCFSYVQLHWWCFCLMFVNPSRKQMLVFMHSCNYSALFAIIIIIIIIINHLFTGLGVDGFSLSITFVENLVVVCSHASLR